MIELLPEGIIVLGAGGFAREVYFHMSAYYQNFVFVDDVTDTKELFGHPVIKDWKFPKLEAVEGRSTGWRFIVGIGDPYVKKAMVEKALKAGLTPINTFIHPKALVQDAKLGKGGIVCPGAIITTNVSIGDYVTINLNSTVGHDTAINDYVNISPGCNISGNNRIGEGANIGTGTVTREEASIASYAVVGAQSAVIKDLYEPDCVYVGIPAKPI